MKLSEHNGKIYVQNFCFEEIADKYGTPFYLYDLNVIKKKIQNIKQEFDEAIELFYAVKANSNLEILKEIHNDIDGLDISSLGEMDQSLLAGYDPGCMSFAGPGKTRLELREAIRRKIGIISVESLRELQDIRQISSSEGHRADIALRLNPRFSTKEFAIKMGGKSSQFGIDEEDVFAAIDHIHRNEAVFNLIGIHVYAGTQCMDEEAIARNMDNTLEIAANLQSSFGLECRWINLGGGFGVSYYEENREINLNALARLINQSIKRYMASTGTRPRFILELGRYLVADAGIYVTRVVSEKESRGEKYFILDGGMNHHLAASGNLGAVIRKNYLVKNLSRPQASSQTCNLVGPLCTPLDLMGRNVSIESPRLGDVIGIKNSGSYAFTASPLFFLGHETPMELLLLDDRIKVIRNRKTIADFN
jgi:diaminopimelate decarboxylase